VLGKNRVSRLKCLHKEGAGHPMVSDENVESICEVFVHSPLSQLELQHVSCICHI
jgi:hypothetical protein